jgi:hypothetical protein
MAFSTGSPFFNLISVMQTGRLTPHTRKRYTNCGVRYPLISRHPSRMLLGYHKGTDAAAAWNEILTQKSPLCPSNCQLRAESKVRIRYFDPRGLTSE